MSEKGRLRIAWAEGALLGSVLAGIAAALSSSRLGGGVTMWLALAGLGALVLGPAVGALRAARPLSPAALGVPLGTLVALPLLVVLGRVLKATTHHRPLGAATFAVLAAAVVLGSIALASRLLVTGMGTERSPSRRLARVALAGLAVAVFALSAMLLRATVSPDAARAGLRSPFLEAFGVLAAGAAAGLARLPPAVGQAARIGGPLVWLVMVACGIVASSV